MAEKELSNVNEKLSKSRELANGLSEEVYALADYMSNVANDTLSPMGMAMCLELALDDIENGRNGFEDTEGDFPSYLIERKNQVLTQAVFFPQIIDAIADEDFATDFRAICKDFLNFDPPKRVVAELKGEYPEYVKVAVDWWSNAVASPNLDNGSDMPVFLMRIVSTTGKNYSEEEIGIFKETLATEIVKEMKQYNSCTLSVDYNPCKTLAIAGEKIDVSPMSGYPWKTRMSITKTEVTVYKEGKTEILWQK